MHRRKLHQSESEALDLDLLNGRARELWAFPAPAGLSLSLVQVLRHDLLLVREEVGLGEPLEQAAVQGSPPAFSGHALKLR